MREHTRVRPTRIQRRHHVRAQVIEKYGRVCFYCGNLLEADFSLDHVIPESQGGKYELENLVSACTSCNREKKDLSLEQYRDFCYRRTLAGGAYVSLTTLLVERGSLGLFTQIEVAALGSIARRLRDLHPSFLFAWELANMDTVAMLVASAEIAGVRA